ncbi:hypothetical protein D5086_025648 [Populus alba]|uniref:Uncharacterized protein n=1 Tax=Populus alba TaxID=43335 RepID=A0ACC4B074_POPAL
MTLECCTLTQPIKINKKLQNQPLKNWEGLLDPVSHESATASRPVKLRRKWMEYQGIRNWEGLLDPLDDNLRGEILRYGHFVDAAYKSFDFDPSSPTYATCRFPKSTLFERCGKPDTGYRLTKHLRATSGIQIPRWTEKAPSWVFTQSSWIGYVAVSLNKAEIARLGRRDVVIAFRDDVITKVPGFVLDGENNVPNKGDLNMASLPSWIQKKVEDTQWVYAEVGRELRLSSKDSPYLNSINVAACHDLKTYLHLVNGFVSSSCPFRAKAKRFFLSNHRR